MKTFIFLFFLFSSLGLLAQEKQVQNFKAVINQDSILKADLQNIQSCLASYHLERKRAYCLGIFSFACVAMGTAALYHPETEIGAYVAYGISAASSIGAMILFIDAEKWLKRASISVSPGKLTINF